jgi:hypothetical protein
MRSGHRRGEGPNVLRLAVEAGQVVCPRRGIIDIERCFTCPGYRGFREGRIETLVCSVDRATGATILPWVPES